MKFEQRYKLSLKHLTFVFCLIFICSCISGISNKQKVIIAAAANMQFVIKELAKTYTQNTGRECELVIGSSGKLTAQIIEGAPYDIFLSADMKYPRKIFEAGLAYAPPQTYAQGILVLWSMTSGLTPSINTLSSQNVHHIAIANPKTAPYGSAAIEVLKAHEVLDKIENKLVYGESISQTNQFIMSKSAELGFTSKSVVVSSEVKDNGEWKEVDSSLYTPIMQGAIIIKRQDGNDIGARQFYEFLFSNQASDILTNYGYSVNE